MEEHQEEASPRVLSRIGGVLYLIIIVGGLFGHAFIRDTLKLRLENAHAAAEAAAVEARRRVRLNEGR
jgi:hypothetical protein